MTGATEVVNRCRDGKKRKFFQRPSWQLFAICYLVGVQSSLTTGFVNSCYSTLERLFNFNSKFTGLIEGSFHAAIVLLVIPVSFYGRNGNKPLIMATGAALIAAGAFCYSSAEFFRERPFSVLNITHAKDNMHLDPKGCNTGVDSGKAEGADASWIKWLFVTGMFLIGVGSTPIQTVAIAYLDQSGKQEGSTGWSLGWFHAVGLLAPACGFVLSGSFLSVPNDISSWKMSKDDAGFMGAWWMGFMLECALALILIPVLATLPNSKPEQGASVADMNQLECKPEETTSGIQSQSDQNENGITATKGSWREDWEAFSLCVKCLMRDKTFLCLLLHGSVLHLTTAGLTAFMPKFFETQYRMIAQLAAFVAGGVSVPAAAIGAIISGYVIKRLHLTCMGTIKMTFMAQGTCIVLATVFFIIRCPYGPVYTSTDLASLREQDASINVSTNFCRDRAPRISCVNQKYNIHSPCLLNCYNNVSTCRS